MSTAITTSHTQREPELPGQTVVVIGGSAGIGLETARRASAEGAKLSTATICSTENRFLFTANLLPR
jgi:NAD(P)-dependent dehydrogenase (short-subunit alcohol dehydrogenase family)